MDYYSTQDVCSIFKISHQTVKNWAIEFASFLSPSATPQAGKKRLFTVDDLRVFALVNEYRDRQFTYEDVHVALRNNQRGEVPSTMFDIVPAPPAELVTSLRLEVTHLREQLTAATSRGDEYKGQVQLLEKIVESKEKQVRELIEEIAILKAEKKRGDSSP